jgi:hypothetical protein
MYTAQHMGHFGKKAINTLVKIEGRDLEVFLIFTSALSALGSCALLLQQQEGVVPEVFISYGFRLWVDIGYFVSGCSTA